MQSVVVKHKSINRWQDIDEQMMIRSLLIFTATVASALVISCSAEQRKNCSVPEDIFLSNGRFVADAIIYDLGDETLTVDFVPLARREELKDKFGFERFVIGYSPRTDKQDLVELGYQGRLLPNQIQPIVAIDRAIEVVRLEGSANLNCDDSGMLWISNLEIESTERSTQQPIELYLETSKLSF